MVTQLVSAPSATTGVVDQPSSLTTAGHLLFFVALIALYLTQGCLLWVSWVRPSAALGGLHYLRLAQRQINGVDRYFEAEVPGLRWLAEDRVARSRSRLVSWVTRLWMITAPVLFVGMAMAPPAFGVGVMAQATTQVFRYLGVVLVLVGVAAVVKTWRPSPDVKAEAFLERTADSAAVQCDGIGRAEDPS
ncbi:hypothetical protein [Mycolicibacterium sp.]|uniref:hypothetical protein n=1 Tax=Mycolicibacterium sp. TaxID=2320850 RepID=UPI001A275BD6|nr:hypothetical protein [Mycolicibacterium sp.]MBJ7338720.1 hypothetical protein [Mycolicibacterium sp.]